MLRLPMIPVRYHRGVELPEQRLWLDPWDPKPLAFVSHAHSDHVGKHPEIITSAATARLMQERLPGDRIEHVLEFEVPSRVREMDITLFPAGHIFGSAQFYLETENGSLLYTGDFKLRPGLSAEPAGWRHAETLIMETTYGLPKYRLPPTDQVIAAMVAFCEEALEDGAVPVLLGYSLGKAQEILCALTRAGLTPMLHGAVFRMTEIYRKLKPDFPCDFIRYDPREVAGKVLICPPSANRTPMLTKIKNRRVAMMTGWALDPGAKYRYQCDAAFPLSDHADYPDLIRYVELVQPRRVLTLHGFASAFARDLRERGFEAWALSQENQLELTLGNQTRRRDDAEKTLKPPRLSASALSSEFAAFSELGERISATTSKLKKIELLRDYFRSIDAAQLPIAATYLTGKPFAQTDARTLQVGWAVIKRALLAVSGIGEARLREISRLHADAGKTALEALAGATDPAPFSLTDSRRFFEELQKIRGPIAKGDRLEKTLAALTPLEASYVVKILTGDLRIGLKEGLVEEAIASAFDAEIDEVREAHMLLGDIGETASLASRRALAEASLHLFTPIKCMLASPEPTAEAVWERVAQASSLPEDAALPDSAGQDVRATGFWVEDKYDGIRAQLHRRADRVEIYTRDLKRVSDQFDEISTRARALRESVIFDGEIIAFERGRKLTFFDLQKRLGRKTSADFFLGGDIPVLYVAFDLLWIEGRSLLKEPLRTRRELLERVELPTGFQHIAIGRVASPGDIEAAFQEARKRGNEGLIIKNAESLYTPGRRGIAWMKLKKELATLDVVVVGAEFGHGKRSQVLSDYTFAVRDSGTNRLLPIGKAYSGLTDVEIAELTAHFKAHTLVEHGRYREVEPDTVLEVAFDSVQPSTRHASGLALRFPRIKAIRRDKTPAEIDTLDYARRLVAAS